MLKEGHIDKINEISDEVFIQRKVITVYKDSSVKFALDARAFNQAKEKDNNEKTSLENLLYFVPEKLDSEKRDAWYSSVGMTLSYGQVPLHLLTPKQCNFQIFGGESTKT